MTIEQIYNLQIEMATKADLRGVQAVKRTLDKRRREYEKLSGFEKEIYDVEKLRNPYVDSLLEYGDPKKQVKKVLAGIDMGPSEVLLAEELDDVDLIIGHHCDGRSFANLAEVMELQAEVLAKHGVPINVAEGIMSERIQEVKRKIHHSNFMRSVDTAKLVNIAYLCSHTTCDNLSANYMQTLMRKAKPETVQDVLSVLHSQPEYKQAAKEGHGPMLFAGSPSNYCGKVVVTEFTGGTEGSKMIYEKLSQAGIGTILSMHLNEESRKEAMKNHINIVVAGHMSSDSLGMNLFLDQLEKRGIEIVPTSGLIRVSRNKKPNYTKSRRTR